MFHGVLSACVDARFEDLRFEDSNPGMGMKTWRLVLELSCMYLCDATWLGFVNPNKDNIYSVESLCDTSLVFVPRSTYQC